MKVQSLLFLQHSHPAKVERKRCRVTVASCMMLRESAARRLVVVIGPTSTVARAEFPVQAAAAAVTSMARGSAGIGLRRALRRCRPVAHRRVGGGRLEVILDVCVTSLGLLRGNSRAGSLGSDDVSVFGVVFPSGGIVLERVLAEVAKRWSCVASTASTTAGLSRRSVVELSCVMVALTTVGPNMVNAVDPF
ncbi:hypothetical protein VPH35_096402 [Triticum aestivum]